MKEGLKNLELELSKIDDQIKELKSKKDILCRTFVNENISLKENDKVKVITVNTAEYGILEGIFIHRFLNESYVKYSVKAFKKNGEMSKNKYVQIWHNSKVRKA